jgi:ABC-type cobalamin/Fe3+-siderophores transport system ATPase subunit
MPELEDAHDATALGKRTWFSGVLRSSSPGDIVLIVGSNNAGKSATLRAVRDKYDPIHESPVVTSLKVSTTGGADELAGWLQLVAKREQRASRTIHVYQAHGSGVHLQQLDTGGLTKLTAFTASGGSFATCITADER